MTKMVHKIFLMVLLLLIPGRLLAMDFFNSLGNFSYSKEVAIFVIGLGGGAGLLWAAKSVTKGSGIPKCKKLADEGARLLKSGEIAVRADDLRAKLGLDDGDDLPEHVLDTIIGYAYKQGFKLGKKKGRKPFVEKLNTMYDGNYPEDWAEQSYADCCAICDFLDNGHPGYQGDGKKRVNFVLEALHDQKNTFGIYTAKKAFKDFTAYWPEDKKLKTYLNGKIQRYMKRAEHEEKIKKLKLLIAKKLITKYSGTPPSDFKKFGTWLDRRIERNFTRNNENQ